MWKRIGVIVLFFGVVGLAFLSKGNLQWSENVADILPQSAEFADYMKLVSVFRPDNKAFFLIKKSSPQVSEDTLIEAADHLAAQLENSRQDQTKLFTKVLYRQDIDPMESIDFFLNRQGFYFDETVSATVTERLENQWLDERFAGIRQQLYESPAPGLMKLVSNDPLDLSGARFASLQALLPNQGKISLHRGRLFSDDLQAILIIAEPVGESTEISQAQHLVTQVSRILETTGKQSSGVSVSWLAGQRFSIENANIIRADIMRIFIISSALILLMVWLALRQFAGVLVLVLPWIFGLAVAFTLISLTHSSVSVIALGMASILAGITVDYGIYVLCFGRELGSAHKAAVKLRNPLLIAVSTSVIAFAALMFSGITVLQQLGEIASYWVVSSAAFALFCLPPLLSWFNLEKKRDFDLDIGRGQRKLLDLSQKKRFIMLVLLSVLLLPGLSMLTVEDDLQNFNAAGKDTRADFDEIGDLISINRKTLYAVVHGPDFENVLERNWRLSQELNKLTTQGELNTVSSIADLLPPRSVQETNLTLWENFWNADRKNRLTRLIEKAAESSGMQAPVFQPYVQQLGTRPDALMELEKLPGSLKQLAAEHLRLHDGVNYVLTRIEPAENVDVQALAQKIRTLVPGLIAADMGVLRHNTMNLFINGLLQLSGIVFVLITVFLLLFIRDVRRAFVLMLPLLLAFLWTFGLLGWLHVKIDASSSIVSVILFGIMIDYSIYITDSIKKRSPFGALPTAITLSLLSTILGFGSLILADHPVMHACGIATLATTLCGWLAVSFASFLYTPSVKKNER